MTEKIVSTMVVIAAILTLKLSVGHHPLNVGSYIVGTLWLLAAAVLVFWPSLRARTRILGLAGIVVAATFVSEAASHFRVFRFAMDGSVPWGDWLRVVCFTALVQCGNIAFVVGIAWLLTSVTARIRRARPA